MIILEALEFLLTIDLLIWLAAGFGPYVVGTFCPGGSFSFTNDCTALFGSQPSSLGTLVTVMTQAILTIVGLYYATRRLFASTVSTSSMRDKVMQMAATVVSCGFLIGLIYLTFFSQS